jgi:hypothetical protein
MRLKKLIVQAVIASVLVIGFGMTAITGSLATSYGQPSAQSIAYAKETTDILQARLLAALGQEFAATTAATAPKASDAISLIFDDDNHSMRLVGTVGPLRRNDYPKDKFEQMVVARALNEQLPFDPANPINAVEGKPGAWYYRRALPVNNKMAPSCVLCHVNYGSLPANKQTVGVLALKVPIK